MKALVKKVVPKGVSRVEIVVKTQKGIICGLWLDIPTMGGHSGLDSLAFFINSKGEVSLKSETGAVEQNLTDDDLRARLELHHSAADISSSTSVLQIGIDNDLSYGRFAEEFTILNPYSKIIYFTDTDEQRPLLPKVREPGLPSPSRVRN